MVPFLRDYSRPLGKAAGKGALGAAAGLGGAALGLAPPVALGLGAAAALGGAKKLGKSNRSKIASGLLGRRKRRMNKG